MMITYRIICSHKEILWLIAVCCLCLLFLLLRSTTTGIALAYRLRAYLIFKEFRRRGRGLPSHAYPEVIPKFPKMVGALMLISVIWITIIVVRDIKLSQTNAHTISTTSSMATSISTAPAMTTNSELDLMIRSSPSIHSNILGSYPPNTKIIVECFAEGDWVSDGVIESLVWYKIYNYDAWVSSVYVSLSHNVSSCSN